MGQAQVYQYKVSALSTVLASAQVLFMAFMDRLQHSSSIYTIHTHRFNINLRRGTPLSPLRTSARFSSCVTPFVCSIQPCAHVCVVCACVCVCVLNGIAILVLPLALTLRFAALLLCVVAALLLQASSFVVTSGPRDGSINFCPDIQRFLPSECHPNSDCSQITCDVDIGP